MNISGVRSLGKNPKGVRRTNNGNLLKLLHMHGGLSRTELARRMNLSKMAISNMVNALLAQDYLTADKSSNVQNSGGPIPSLLTISSGCLLAIGVSVTRLFVECVIADITEGAIYSERHVFRDASDRADIHAIVTRLIANVYLQAETHQDKILGIGVVVAGLVDRTQTYVDDRPNHLGDIENDLRPTLETYGIPVVFMNNMSASAMGEYYFGSERGTSSFIYLGIGDGVGAGIYNGGRLIEGQNGFAGELGHLTIADNGLPLPLWQHGLCRTLCILNISSGGSSGFKLGDLLDLLERRPEELKPILDRYSDYLTTLLVNAIHNNDPGCVIIGGHLTSLGERFFSDISHKVNRRIMWRTRQHVPIIRSAFGIEAPIAGSYSVIFNMLFNGQIEFLEDG